MTTPADWYPKDLQSRPHESRRRRVLTRIGERDIVYCVSCHAPKGSVNPECPSVLLICEECAGRYGGLPVPKLTDEDLDAIGYHKEG